MSDFVERLRAHARDDRNTAEIQETWQRRGMQDRAVGAAYLRRAADLEGAAAEIERLRAVLDEIAAHAGPADDEASHWMATRASDAVTRSGSL